MRKPTIAIIAVFLGILASTLIFKAKPITPVKPAKKVLSQVTYSLTDRYANSYVNNIFADNIRLTLAYMSGKVKAGQQISWNKIATPGVETLLLKPDQTFAFHDEVLDKYKGKVIKTTNAHFNSDEGFKSDGWLVGDGVCHLASFMYVASKDAGLKSEAPTRHDFATIPDVSEQNGVSIFFSPDNPGSSELQNLYITNNRNKTVAFIFTQGKNNLNIKVEEYN